MRYVRLSGFEIVLHRAQIGWMESFDHDILWPCLKRSDCAFYLLKTFSQLLVCMFAYNVSIVQCSELGEIQDI